MLDARRIEKLFKALNTELKARDAAGEVVLCGGAVMCLVFKSRAATRDVDAIFKPAREMREAAKAVAARFDAPKDWLNDAAKGFLGAPPPRRKLLDLSHLRVYAPTADYMLAMKCLSARFDGHDRDDIKTLLKHLDIRDPEKVFDVVERYYPKRRVPPKTRFLVEELLGTDQDGPGATRQ